jgi:hypothetical protein
VEGEAHFRNGGSFVGWVGSFLDRVAHWQDRWLIFGMGVAHWWDGMAHFLNGMANMWDTITHFLGGVALGGWDGSFMV